MTVKVKDAPAFPSPESVELKDFGRVEHAVARGMSLRDYFAASALSALLVQAMPDLGKLAAFETGAAEAAYRFADTMLAARERDQ